MMEKTRCILLIYYFYICIYNIIIMNLFIIIYIYILLNKILFYNKENYKKKFKFF